MTAITGQDTGRIVVVVLDRAHARFFEVTPGGVTELASFHSPATRGGRFHSDRGGSPGYGEHAYHGRLHEEERRHMDGIVQHLQSLEHEPGDALLVAGNEAVVAGLLRVLPPNLTDRVIGSAHLNPLEVTPAVVERAAHAAAEAHRPVVEEGLVRAMERGLGSGHATNGARETLRALAQRQVRTLLVAAGTRGSGFRCTLSGRLVLSEADCMGEGAPTQVGDLIGAATAEAEKEGGTVELISDPALARRVDGIAALLRFASS